ncbi:hypothetical protein QVD17_03560 [Tagetes erecta]|uniref:Uncharacterized protein n=1 Tax=Tagetes erecta TaxID=13708 RepID=A0AAD8PA27_TARER|nr:hypothetical protein QVD17_03560 [Tagetes erecta]
MSTVRKVVGTTIASTSSSATSLHIDHGDCYCVYRYCSALFCSAEETQAEMSDKIQETQVRLRKLQQ